MKTVRDFIISAHRFITPEHFVIELQSDEELPMMHPGQFVELKVEGSAKTFLRRPFSIHSVDYKRNTITLLIQILGEGTAALSRKKPGDRLNLIFPLGNHFSLPKKQNSRLLLVGGGCGVAPLLFLAQSLFNNNHEIDILTGARSKAFLLETDLLSQYGTVHITTEDGSLGEKGFVTHHPVMKGLEQFTMVYTCGPDAMMKAIGIHAQRKEVDCEASLENTMACGIGACLCCVQKTSRGNLCVCTDGPVFNVKELIW